MRAFSDLTERDLQEGYPDSAKMFSGKVMFGGALALDTGSA
jgi:hypothetical protein